MSKNQVLVIVFDSIILVLAIWNLVLALQNMKLEEMKKNNKKGN